jgi:tRNA/rRNA methyltransferase
LYQLGVGEALAIAAAPDVDLPDGEQLERISHLLLEVLVESDFTQPHTHAAVEDKVRRLIRRMQLSSEDAELWLGMLRQIRWRIRKS